VKINTQPPEDARCGASICQHQRQMSQCKECGATRDEHLPAPAPEEPMQGVRGREHLPSQAPKEPMQGVRGAGCARTSAKGANARSAGAQACARTNASVANARSAARRRSRRCPPAWRSSREQRMLLVKTCDLLHDPYDRTNKTTHTQFSSATHGKDE
jgi:hypothetical protein